MTDFVFHLTSAFLLKVWAEKTGFTIPIPYRSGLDNWCIAVSSL